MLAEFRAKPCSPVFFSWKISDLPMRKVFTGNLDSENTEITGEVASPVISALFTQKLPVAPAPGSSSQAPQHRAVFFLN